MFSINTTLLRYPGGKSRAVKQILKYIPKNITELCSPFLGGASIEIALNNNGVKIYGYDLFNCLIDFWTYVIKNPVELAVNIKKYFPLEKEKFYEMQKTIHGTEDGFERATMYYVLNRCSFSGSTLSGGMSPNHPRFTESGIQKIKKSMFNNFSVECLGFHDSLAKHTNTFVYADPPYLIKNALYGTKGDMHKNFDHKGLHDILTHRGNWVLSYNDCDEIREMYKDYRIETLNWKYGMSKEKISNEILIINC